MFATKNYFSNCVVFFTFKGTGFDNIEMVEVEITVFPGYRCQPIKVSQKEITCYVVGEPHDLRPVTVSAHGVLLIYFCDVYITSASIKIPLLMLNVIICMYVCMYVCM